MKILENGVELSGPCDFSQFGIPHDMTAYGSITVSQEFIQDSVAKFAIRTPEITDEEINLWHEWDNWFDNKQHLSSCLIRSGEITDEEIKEWSKWDEYLLNLNLDEARRRVCITTDRYPPYQ